MVLIDVFGKAVRLPEERLEHVMLHPELRGLDEEIKRTLREPEFVRKSEWDQSVQLYYRKVSLPIVGNKWLTVVVRYDMDDAFVLTSYVTDRPKEGETVWPTT